MKLKLKVSKASNVLKMGQCGRDTTPRCGAGYRQT